MAATKDKDRYVVVEWPECQYFMGDRTAIHLASGHNDYVKFGDSVYFVSVGHFIEVTGQQPFEHGPVYLAVQFPESQLFMEGHQDETYLINDKRGIEKYGLAACFVEENLYKKVIENFEKEVSVSSTSNRFDHNC